MPTEKDLPLPVDYLYRGLHIAPDAIAAEDAQEQITYRELVDRVQALALALQQKLPESSRVGLCAQNHIGHLTTFLALIAGGFIWVPINPKNGQQLNAGLIQKSQPALLIVDTASISSIDTAKHPVIMLDESTTPNIHTLIAEYRAQPFSPQRPSPDAIMGIKFTGGTTGEPKGVMQSHANVAAVVENMQAQFAFQQSDCNLAVAPLTHGGSHYILPLLAVGGRHILLAEPKPESIINAFKNRGASVSFMPPTLIYKLIDQPGISLKDFPQLRHLTYSAAPMPPERINQVIEKLGPHLSTVYGQTEAPMTITAMSAKDMTDESLRASVGKACQLSDVAILDDQGNRLANGETGEVAVRGSIVMAGYFNDPEKTQDCFHNNWLLTGDLGYLNNEGYLFLQGRSKEMIISGGFNVYPAEIENALMQLGGIKECAAFGVEDEYWGERIEVAVCLQIPESKNKEQLQQQLKKQLGAVKTPKKIHFIEELPRNPVGKVVRREVKQLFNQDSVQ